MAIANAHRGAGRLYVFVNEYESEYIAGRLTDAEGTEIDPGAGEIAVYSMDVGEDETGMPISVPVTVADLVQQALRTFPGNIETELLRSENEDAALSGFYYLPLPLGDGS